MSNGNREIIKEKIKTDEGFKMFVAMELVDQSERLGAVSTALDKHSNRIGVLESWRNYLTGAWAVVILIASYLGLRK